MVSNFGVYVGGAPATGITNDNTSTTWQILNVQAKCDIKALDGGRNESYTKLLEKGRK